MNRVFVDTAALIALGNKQDRWHDQAVAISRQLTLAARDHLGGQGAETTCELALQDAGHTRQAPLALVVFLPLIKFFGKGHFQLRQVTDLGQDQGVLDGMVGDQGRNSLIKDGEGDRRGPALTAIVQPLLAGLDPPYPMASAFKARIGTLSEASTPLS